MIPLAAVVVAFTVSNRGTVHLDLWPTSYSLDIPVFAAVLSAAVIGFLAGAVVSFVAAGRRRARNRQLARMLENSKREQAYLREQVKKLETTLAADQPTAQVSAVPLLTKKDAA
jgi:uncharacterized integral membrane protein